MIFLKNDVYLMCKRVAPIFKFDAKLVFAICLQEGGRTKNGNFKPDMARLEQGFYLRYIEKQNYPTTNEVLYSASYGIMQMMGISLKEVGFFKWWFNQKSDKAKIYLKSAYSEISIPKAINAYCVNLEWMIVWGTRWLKRKDKRAKGNIEKLAMYWNGDTTGKYYKELMKKYNSIKN